MDLDTAARAGRSSCLGTPSVMRGSRSRRIGSGPREAEACTGLDLDAAAHADRGSCSSTPSVMWGTSCAAEGSSACGGALAVCLKAAAGGGRGLDRGRHWVDEEAAFVSVRSGVLAAAVRRSAAAARW